MFYAVLCEVGYNSKLTNKNILFKYNSTREFFVAIAVYIKKNRNSTHSLRISRVRRITVNYLGLGLCYPPQPLASVNKANLVLDNSIVNRARWFGNSLELKYKSLSMFLFWFMQE